MDRGPLFNKPHVTEDCVRTIGYNTLNHLIKMVYGIYTTSHGIARCFYDFNIVVMEEWNNDEMHRFNVRAEPLSKWDQEQLEDFMRDPYSAQYCLAVLLTDLCNQGHIDPGEYIIDVVW